MKLACAHSTIELTPSAPCEINVQLGTDPTLTTSPVLVATILNWACRRPPTLCVWPQQMAREWHGPFAQPFPFLGGFLSTINALYH